MKSFRYHPNTSFRGVLTLLILVLVRSFSNILMLVVVSSFYYTPDACFSDEFSPKLLMLVLVTGFTLLMLVLVRNFSYTPRAGFSEEFLLHASC